MTASSLPIDIRDLRALLINLDDQTERLSLAGQLLESLGISWKRVPGVPRGPRIGHAAATLAALQQALTIDQPIMVLEDDIALTENPISEFSIPLNADAVYLGHSIWGHGDSDGGGPIERGFRWEATELPDIVRLDNMLSTHAIIYMTPRYKRFVADQAIECVRFDHHLDMRVSRRFSEFHVYATRHPVFYQAGGNESVTNLSICEMR